MQFWLAPLHGITNHQFRNCLNRHVEGFNLAVTPFLAVLPKAQLKARLWTDVLPENNPQLAVIPQLMGNRPADFVDTVLALQALGYQRLNWNIGCPSAQVVRHTRGCGLMPFPDKVEEVVKLVAKETQCRFSVKMRLGMHAPDEGLEIIRRLNRYPLDFVAIHPRLGEQQYDGVPDLTSFQKFYDLCEHPIVYSGDIVDQDSYQKIISQFPDIQACMLGRGALKNIFLAEELSTGTAIPIDEKRFRFKSFYDEFSAAMVIQRGENGALSNLKELWHYFSVFFKLQDEELRNLLRINNLYDFQTKVETIFQSAV